MRNACNVSKIQVKIVLAMACSFTTK